MKSVLHIKTTVTGKATISRQDLIDFLYDRKVISKNADEIKVTITLSGGGSCRSDEELEMAEEGECDAMFTSVVVTWTEGT